MNLTVETERESAGRWIAEVLELPGVLAYGATRERAIAGAEALAFARYRIDTSSKATQRSAIHVLGRQLTNLSM